jgi:hypothetical protein
MKLAELFHGHSAKIKRPEVINKGNDKIVYLGTDAIQRPHSGPQAYGAEKKSTIPTINKRLKIKRAGRMAGKKGEETLWLDNPTATPCSSCGY